MSEYVYFNEPGHEGEMGTPQGELLNQAYTNVVRISNLKYAMNEQITNPTKGFEEVILKSFFLKKDVILKEVRGWVLEADKNASYTGLVNSHNATICAKYTKDPKQYKVDLE